MNIWRQYLSQSLVGLDQSPTPVEISPDHPLAPMLRAARENRSPAEAILDELSVIANWRRCGLLPRKTASRPNTSPKETLLPCSPAARACLSEIVDAGHDIRLVEQWLQLAHASQRLVPPELLPSLLNRCLSHPELTPLLLAAGGNRAAWLAGLNEAWRGLCAPTSNDLWLEGKPAERLRALEALLRQNRSDALALVESSWKTEPAAFRAKIVATICQDAGPESEAFLTAAVSDKSQETRFEAMLGLCRLRESTFAKDLAQSALERLVFKSPGLLSKGSIDFNLPDESFIEARKLEIKPLVKSGRIGEKAAALALLIASCPMATWLERARLNPEKLVALASRSEFSFAILSGLAASAAWSADAPSIKAFLTTESPSDLLIERSKLLSFLPRPSAESLAAELIEAGALSLIPVKSGCHFEANTLPGPWSARLSSAVARRLLELVRNETPFWSAKELMGNLALQLDPATSLPIIANWRPSDVWRDAADRLSGILSFRQRMTAAFRSKD